MTLAFTQGHRITRKLKLCNYSVVEEYEVAKTVAMVDYVKELLVKMSLRYGKYGSY